MNDTERQQWVENDEGLYDWWRRSGKGITVFVRENRAELSACISSMLRNDKPAHYLKYGS